MNKIIKMICLNRRHEASHLQKYLFCNVSGNDLFPFYIL